LSRPLIVERTVNVLVESAALDPAFNRLSLVAALAVFRFVRGGLWVGGNLRLFEDGLEFRPNGRNLQLHKPGSIGPIKLRFDAKTTAEMKRAILLTNIVTVANSTGKLVFRCYEAESFFDDIKNAIAKTKPN
jgi:hypothetical protein